MATCEMSPGQLRNLKQPGLGILSVAKPRLCSCFVPIAESVSLEMLDEDMLDTRRPDLEGFDRSRADERIEASEIGRGPGDRRRPSRIASSWS
jgi:hypothetical protein